MAASGGGLAEQNSKVSSEFIGCETLIVATSLYDQMRYLRPAEKVRVEERDPVTNLLEKENCFP